VAALLGITRQRVHQLADAGRLPHYRTPLGYRRFPRRCVEQFIQDRRRDEHV
jgi:excisionase family DNA binding protein